MGLITLTKQSSRGTFNLNQDDIVKMYEKSSTTIIEYIDQENGILKSEAVSEDIADVFALTTNLAQTTIGGVTLYLNASRVIYTTEINSLAVVNYNNGGSNPEVLKLDVDEATFIASLPTSFNEPKVYVALITQSGTNAPILTELENTLGVTLSTSRTGAGQYKLIAPSSIFLSGKTWTNISQFQLDGAAADIRRTSDTEITVLSGLSNTLALSDSRLVGNSLKIIVRD